jgi:hypothetical protein
LNLPDFLKLGDLQAKICATTSPTEHSNANPLAELCKPPKKTQPSCCERACARDGSLLSPLSCAFGEEDERRRPDCRFLALAAIYGCDAHRGGKDRRCVGLQIIRDCFCGSTRRAGRSPGRQDAGPEPPSSKTAPGDRPVIESGPLVHPVVRWRLRSGAMDLRAIPHHDRQADAQPRAARHRLQQNSARPRPCRLRKEPYPNSKEGPHVLAAAWRDRHAPRSQHPLRRDLPRARRSTFMRTSIANAGSGELDQAAQGAFQPRRE